MTIHIPVLKKEVIKYLAPRKNQNFIDCTLGFGGHTREILKKTGPTGQLLGIDQDSVALQETEKYLTPFKNRIKLVQANFKHLEKLANDWNVKEINGILFDLGVSTYQLLTPERGFSFNLDSPLDMRMDQDHQMLLAADIVNKFPEKEISKILYTLGEERFARQIAKSIVQHRQKRPFIKSGDLVEVIKQAIPPKFRFSAQHHFATATFRALRMKVNEELENLEQSLPQAKNILSPGGRLVVISFHSLEDRIVKNFIRDSEDLENLTKKPIMASELEIIENPKARSAKLRAAVKKGDRFQVKG